MALECDAAADIEAVLSKVYTSYAKLRRAVELRQVKHQAGRYIVAKNLLWSNGEANVADQNEKKDLPPSTKARLALPPLLPVASVQPELQRTISETSLLDLDNQPLPPTIPSCSFPHSVVHPLSPVVSDLLGMSDSCSTDLRWSSDAYCLAEQYRKVSRAVFRVSLVREGRATS